MYNKTNEALTEWVDRKRKWRGDRRENDKQRPGGLCEKRNKEN